MIRKEKKVFNLRLNLKMKSAVEEKAESLGISQNSVISLAVSEFVKKNT